eukprot:754375-Hanusia_phi.AAC.1
MEKFKPVPKIDSDFPACPAPATIQIDLGRAWVVKGFPCQGVPRAFHWTSSPASSMLPYHKNGVYPLHCPGSNILNVRNVYSQVPIQVNASSFMQKQPTPAAFSKDISNMPRPVKRIKDAKPLQDAKPRAPARKDVKNDISEHFIARLEAKVKAQMEKEKAMVASECVEAPPPVEEVPIAPVQASVPVVAFKPIQEPIQRPIQRPIQGPPPPPAEGVESTCDRDNEYNGPRLVPLAEQYANKGCDEEDRAIASDLAFLNKAFFDKSQKRPEKEPLNIKIYAADSMLLYPSGRMVLSENIMNDVVKVVPMRDFNVFNHAVVLDEYELKKLQRKSPDEAPDFFAADRESKEVNVLYCHE